MDLTERQEYELLAAISARGEIPAKFTYLGEGAARWDALYRETKHSSRVTIEEMALIMSHIGSFVQTFSGARGINLIDLGCGNGLPAIKILKKLREEGLSVNYVSLDLSPEVLTLASNNIKKELPDVPVTELQLDFEIESIGPQVLGVKQQSKLPNLLINLGNTLGNYVNVSAVLTNFLEAMTTDDYLIIGNGLFNDQNPHKILESYLSVEEKEVLTLPARELGLFTDDDDYKVLWNAMQHRIEARIKLNQDRQITLAGQTMRLESGDEILVMQSRKYTEVSLTKLLSDVGFRTELLTTNRNRSYVLAMIQPTRYSAS